MPLRYGYNVQNKRGGGETVFTSAVERAETKTQKGSDCPTVFMSDAMIKRKIAIKIKQPTEQPILVQPKPNGIIMNGLRRFAIGPENGSRRG